MQPAENAVRELWHALRMGRMPARKPTAHRMHELSDVDPLDPPRLHTGKPTFSPELVREMRASSETHLEWADRLGVHESTIRQCRTGKTYRDVT